MRIQVVATVAWILFLLGAWTPADAITLDLDKEDGRIYSDFLTQIRDNVKDPQLIYGGMTDVPVIRNPVVGDSHLIIDLETEGKIISLAVDRKTLYVVAYKAMDNANTAHVYYFDGTITPNQLHVVFPNVAQAAQHRLEYGENYQAIENACTPPGKPGIDRKTLGLGIQKLKFLFKGVNGKLRNSQNEAKFLLLAIQMVSEAARFKYIEGLVLKKYPYDSPSDDKVLKLEVSWRKISEAIYKNARDGVFPKPIDFEFGKITNVKDLEMGLLMNVGNKVADGFAADI